MLCSVFVRFTKKDVTFMVSLCNVVHSQEKNVTNSRGKRAVISRDGAQMTMERFISTDQTINPYLRKIINNYEKVIRIAEGQRALGHRVVVTIGGWDGIHEGQMRYVLKASQLGDFLIVGVDSDEAIRRYKSDDWRPIRNQERRSELMTYLEFVDVVTLVEDVDETGKWQYGLLEAVKPDVYVAVTDSYPRRQLSEIRKLCGELVVLERQGVGISTTAEIEAVLLQRIGKGFDQMIQSIKEGKI